MDTIAAIITAPAAGAVGVIRISGKNAFNIADRVFKGRCGGLAAQKSHTVHYGFIYDSGGAQMDNCLATVFASPNSYTGEHTVELSCHGGRFLLQSILSLVISAGARPALPGEFTKRAFLNGKMDLSQAEAVADLIAAQGEKEAKNAAKQLSGVLGGRISQIIDSLLTENAAILAYVDFPDEDIPEPRLRRLCSTLDRIRRECDSLISTYGRGSVLKDGVRCVLLGKPNTGKSSLMNRLSGRENSIVTDEEGTTRDIVEDVLILDDIKLRLMDTAGLRQSFSKAEARGVERAEKAAEKSELLLCVFDGSRPPDDNDKPVFKIAAKKTSIAILNKCDLPNVFPPASLREHFKYTAQVSALTGEGIKALTDIIRKTLLGDDAAAGEETLITSLRQRDALIKASAALSRALDSAESGLSLDVLSYDISEAARALGLMTGRAAGERTIDLIFSNFCVGK